MTESIAQFVTCYLFGPQDPKPWYLSGLTEQATTSGGGNFIAPKWHFFAKCITTITQLSWVKNFIGLA